jgi:type VI secretion system secreted protein VgrG
VAHRANRMPYTQENRLIAVDTPLGADVLLLQGLTGNEGVSRLFRFDLDLLSEKNSISFKDVVGQNVTIRITLGDNTPRYFNGFVSRFAQSGSDVRFTHYQMEVVPWLWFLTRIADCRIFQEKAIPDIIKAVFDSRGFQDYRFSLTSTYDPREYCVQYRETDFNFVSRLMEQYGIFYFFEHENGKHTLVLGDSESVHQPCPHQSKAGYNLVVGGLDADDVVTGWHMEQELRTGKYSLTDYNFETPSANLMANEPTVVNVGGNSAYEIYDYPGEYPNKSQGKTLAAVRMQEEEASHLVVSGSSVCRAFTTGYKFTLEDHYRDDMNTSYVLTEIQHVASVEGSYTTGDETAGEHYSNHFNCIPANVPFRPPRRTREPFVQGPQTALVVGKSGEEIWVDKYGRIKVQFYWDRLGTKDEKSSCWIRVSQPWAGAGWGAMWIPRMGQEVIVDFLEGDPDRPLITGRVYNAEQIVPYSLPDNQTRSTFLSRSSKGGGASNFNEMRFEDKKDSEQIFMNAEKDMDLRVEKESREFVGANRHLIVKANQQELVEGDKHGHVKGTHFEKIEGDMSLQINGKQMQKIGGDQSIELDSDQKEKVVGNVSLQVGKDQMTQIGGSVSLQVGQSRNEKIGQTHAMEAVQTIHLKAGMTVIIEAGMQLSLKGPGGFVDIGPAGVTIQGTMVLINSGGAAGSAPDASPQSPADPDAPTDPKDPDVADDGSKGGKLNQ